MLKGKVTASYSGPGMGVAVARFSNGTPQLRTTPGPAGGLSFALGDGGSDDEDGGGPADDSRTAHSSLFAETARVRYKSAAVSTDCRLALNPHTHTVLPLAHRSRVLKRALLRDAVVCFWTPHTCAGGSMCQHVGCGCAWWWWWWCSSAPQLSTVLGPCSHAIFTSAKRSIRFVEPIVSTELSFRRSGHCWISHCKPFEKCWCLIATQSTDCGAQSLHAYACVSLAQTDLPSRLPSQGTLWERSPGPRFIFWTLICTRWCHESRRPRWLRRHTDHSERGKKFSPRRLSSQSLLVRWRCRHRVPSVPWANGTARTNRCWLANGPTSPSFR
jgi:hypothetical protein